MVIVSCRIILSDHFAQFFVFKVPREKVISHTLDFWLQFCEKKVRLIHGLAAEINTEVKNTFVNHITCLNIVMLVPLNFKSATSCEIDCEILLTTLRKVYRIYSCPTCMLK